MFVSIGVSLLYWKKKKTMLIMSNIRNFWNWSTTTHLENKQLLLYFILSLNHCVCSIFISKIEWFIAVSLMESVISVFINTITSTKALLHIHSRTHTHSSFYKKNPHATLSLSYSANKHTIYISITIYKIFAANISIYKISNVSV